MILFTKSEWMVGLRLIRAMLEMLRPGRKPGCGYYVERNAASRPEKTAVLFEDRSMTYSELNAASNRVARLFKSLGANKGDTAALFMENCPEYLIAIAGLSKLGVVASLINTNLRHKTLAHAFNICKPRWIIAGANLAPEVEAVAGEIGVKRENIFIWDGPAPAGFEARQLDKLVEPMPSDNPRPRHRPGFNEHTINIYTSGTTGLPKAARVSNRRWFFTAWALGYAMTRMSPADIIYVPLPLYHSIGMLVGWGGALVTGAGIGIRRKFSASDFWKEARRFNATATTFIGEMPRYLLNQPPASHDKEHSIRQVITVGLRANVWEEFERRFGIPKIFEFYGATETNVGIMNADGRPGYLGRLLPGQGVIVKWDYENEDLLRDKKGRCIPCRPGESGVLLGSSFSLLGFDGYLDEKETEAKIVRGVKRASDEYFNTGDMVKVHEDQWVSFVDRLGDTFRWKGENVSTKEVELILDGHPAVEEVNVYGVAVPGHEGRAGMAAMVFKNGWDCSEFSKFVLDNLPHYARPLFIRKCAHMQTTVTLKHVKYNLRKEGFNPAELKDPLYFWDKSKEQYVPMNEDLHADILAGNIKL